MSGTLYDIRLMSGKEYRQVFIRSTDEYHAAKAVEERIKGNVKILSIEAKGVKEKET